jgi:hypothetical protein
MSVKNNLHRVKKVHQSVDVKMSGGVPYKTTLQKLMIKRRRVTSMQRNFRTLFRQVNICYKYCSKRDRQKMKAECKKSE